MGKKTLKLLLVAALVAGASSAVTLKVAWATPPAGATNTLLAGPIEFGDIDAAANTEDFKARIKTKGPADGYAVVVKIAPDGNTGWHSHPGLAFALVRAGTLTLYDGDFNSAVVPAGTGFVEEPGHVHIGVNEGTTDVEVVVFFLSPKGAGTRIDQPAPQP
jgi:quercetin dioxygenase-like cupin family protein